MSSTGRGSKRSPADFYRTPPGPVYRLLDVLLERLGEVGVRALLTGGPWLEYGAGEGDIIFAVNVWCARQGLPLPRWIAIELRDGCSLILEQLADEVLIGDCFPKLATLAARGEQVSMAIGNPAFSIAFDVVQALLPISRWVTALERSPWLGDAKERRRFFSKLMPLYEAEIGRVAFGRPPPAPGEKRKSATDSIPYSWFVWGPGNRARTTTEKLLLPASPRSEMRAPAPTVPGIEETDLFTRSAG